MAKRSISSEGASNISARSSVRYRVIAGLIIIMIAFAGLTVYSIVLHKRTVAKIELINTSYLPLIFGTGEIRKTQLVFNTLMDRLADDPHHSVTREWIDAARRFRPRELRRLMTLVGDTLAHGVHENEAAFLNEMRKRLSEVELRFVENERKFLDLYNLMDTGHNDKATIRIEGLKRVERNLDDVLGGIGEEIEQHITVLAEEAEQDGTRSTWILGLLTVVALVVAGAVIISTNRLLAPLKTLQEAATKVARGELQTRIEVANRDEIGALAARFNQMTEALTERDEMLIRSERLATAGKMAAQVTHEIRNPLSSLGLNAELLEEELAQISDSIEARSLLAAMQDEIERLTGITESYLRFARLPSPEPAFDNLNDTVESTLEFMKSEIADRRVVVKTDLASHLGPVLFDRQQIRQALSNLLRNAYEAMSDGGEIRVTTQRRADMVELAVSDTGDGVPEEALEHIFESFYSTKSSGTGLGLPLVRQICLAHGGDVRYKDATGKGSTFIVVLPGTHTATETEEKSS
ncbi:MAG: HAMP domain-containing protein [Deltaproteobacteria bacterium]|nr:HAMP domain-containing protein [Deltaproteobacteria bacterium]